MVQYQITDHAAAKFDERFPTLIFRDEWGTIVEFGSQIGDSKLYISENNVVFVVSTDKVIVTVLTKEHAIGNIQAIHHTAWKMCGKKHNKTIPDGLTCKLKEIALTIHGKITDEKIIGYLNKNGINYSRSIINKLKNLCTDNINRRPVKRSKPPAISDQDT